MGYKLGSDGYPETNLTEKECKSVSPDCRVTFKNSFLSWNWLIGIPGSGEIEGVGVRGRWDMRERVTVDVLGIRDDKVVGYRLAT